ncbi:MAG TPA: PQQ-binding-like beta-propeller repeat protein [Pyrinomonadaceae bacterium]|nr:PQQ-binding-like beta-propeller repeat protein [Pyrinomonadaceae bacterium]
MFEEQESKPWHESNVSLIAASVVLPPIGIVLIWIRRGWAVRTKIVGTLAVILLMVVYGYLYRVISTSRANEAHYATLEQHRAEQASAPETQPQPAASEIAQPQANVSQTAASTDAAPTTNSDTASAHAGRNYWTSFRGPNRDGRYEEMQILTNWPAQGLTQVWKQPVGIGYSSFVVADGRAYTIEQRRGKEVATAYDVETGREVWSQGWNAEFTDSTGDGPRSTPTWDQGRIYALGATGELRCLDARNGAVIWGKNILRDNGASNLPWAMAASPLVVDDKVIVLPGGSAGSSVVAYNKTTGAPVWKALNDRQGYVSPMLVSLAGRRQVIIVSSTRIVGLAPEDGAVLWSHPWDTDMGINVSQPVVVDANRFFVSSGYGKGAALVEIGKNGNSFSARTLWENINMKNKFNSSVLHQGHVYGLDEGILTCVDVNTGERKWKGGRYGYGQVILASGHLIVMSDTGDLVLVRATPEQHTEVARFTALQGKSWNYPAIAGGRLLVRNATEMAAYNIAAR